MNAFDNTLIIKDEPYLNGLFPKIPNFKKQYSAYILTDGINDSIIINERTTTKEIRQGKYKRLVEVSTIPYLKEIRFKSSSKETSYSFEIYVKAIIQVKDPIMFYNNKNIDVEAYFDNLFSLDVRKITRKYSILDYDGMADELTRKLASYNTFDESTGFEYRVSIVEAEPSAEAREIVREHNNQSLGATLKKDAKIIGESLKSTYEEAVWAEVARGEISETTAIRKIEEYENLNFDNKIRRIKELRESGFITDVDARSTVNQLVLPGQTSNMKANERAQHDNTKKNDDNIIDIMYAGE